MTNTFTAIAENSGAFHAIKPSQCELFADHTMEEVWLEYKTHPNPSTRDQALKELLYRQNGLICRWANFVHRAHKGMADLDDFIGYAIIAAIYAYDHYDIEKNWKLNTYLGTVVVPLLISQCDEIGYIKCRSGRRAYRSYFRGNYTGEKKIEFEKRHESVLTNEEKRNTIKQQCALIDADIISYEDYTTTATGQVVDRKLQPLFSKPQHATIVDTLDWSLVVDGLTPIQKTVYQLYFVERYTTNEISNKIDLSTASIKKEIKNIKQQFYDMFPDVTRS